jgi:hypothetical protein
MRNFAWLWLLAALPLAAQDKPKDFVDGPCGLPPEAKPQRLKGGEAVPPLPLPATPLRRTERKREPAPPTLVGKLVWGEYRSQVLPDGRKVGWYDWNTDPSDMQRLLKFANAALNIHYRHVNVDPKTFSWDPQEIPVLYAQGRRAIALPEAVRPKLREYILKGGSLWADACHGSPLFAEAFRREMRTVFPDRPMGILGPDHPIYRSTHTVSKVRYSAGMGRPDGPPLLEGIYVGCRTAVIFAPIDLSCAWDSFHCPSDGQCIVGDDAMKLGINMVSYAISYFNLGKFLAQRRSIETDDDSLRGNFIFAQVKTNGHWDPDPSAFANMLKNVLAVTNTKVNFGRKEVPLTDPDLLSYPFLYLTGHGDFVFSPEEVDILRRYLVNGGFLLADACCGNLEFDIAFRRELKRTLSDVSLAELPPEHPVFSTFQKIQQVGYTTQVRTTFKDLAVPYLEGVSIGDDTRVIYSRFDLGCGWEGEEHPYAYGVLPADAQRLAVNIIMYAMTH